MVFFLISVSFGEDCDPPPREVSTRVTSGSSPLQVIYKKFNIPCPLNNNGNITLDFDHYMVNDTEFCKPKMFTVNSQVCSFLF